jgi:hypothetical protein
MMLYDFNAIYLGSSVVVTATGQYSLGLLGEGNIYIAANLRRLFSEHRVQSPRQ